MVPATPTSLLSRWLLAAGVCVALARLEAQEKPAPPAAPESAVVTEAPGTATNEAPIKLAPVDVTARAEDNGYDGTGMGSYEYQLREAPFSNDMISADSIEDDPAVMDLAAEMAIIRAPATAVDLATGDSRVGLRGFPTPLLNNGFMRMGGIDILNTGRTVVIQGALVPVLGRGAPGGIMDFWANRPRTTKSSRYEYSISSLERQTAAVEFNGPTVPKKLWHRLAADWSRRTGPETFAASETRSVNGALTWKHSPKVSTLISIDYLQVHATAAPGIPEYRVASGQKIVGPYLPIAGFNALGPEAGIRRRSLMANILVDAQLSPKVALRAGFEAWWRQIEQDRFTTGLLNLTTSRFEGTREPLHSEQPQEAEVAHVELTGRFAALGGEHKLMLAASHTLSGFEREERALSVAGRNALPASVRLFDPAAPDYWRPPFRPEDYSRVLTDRSEETRYTSIELSDRMGIDKGRAVFTAGVRQDFVTLDLVDRRPGVAPNLAHVEDSSGQLTYQIGGNYQVQPSRLLVFATTSTAFNPSTRVDLRTGRIQGNETTQGFEGGFKARWVQPRLEFTTSVFSFSNQDISRRNPLYGHPVLDANHTQPQLVAAGEERFTGGKIEGSWNPVLPLRFSVRSSYVRAITTASPDLPEEVGRELTRFPPFNASVAGSYGFSKGRLNGLSFSASWIYISDYISNYEDAQRYRLEFPDYSLTTLSVSYTRRIKTRTYSFGLVVRNLFDTDLLHKLARLGAGREIALSCRLMY